MDTDQRQRIESLYLQMYQMLFEYARSIMENDSMAEEAVQDTFQIACQKADALCSSPNPEGWLVNVLKNVISNTLRTKSTAMRMLTDYTSTQIHDISVHEDRIGVDILYGDMAGTEDYQLLKEYALEDCSCLELAQRRNISVTTCRKRLQRARERLRKKLLP